MKVLSEQDLIEVQARAKSAPRGRANTNWHPELSDPVQRFLNAIEPGSYVRPHRHVQPDAKWELFVILSGRVVVLLFDAGGTVTERVQLDAQGGCQAVEIPVGAWHALVALVPSVLFEFKPGPYAVLSDKDFAEWAPAEGEAEAGELVERYAVAQPGDCLRR